MIKGPRAKPDAARFRDIAEAAFKALPEEFRRFVEGVVFQIEEFPDDEIMDEMEIDVAATLEINCVAPAP